MPSSSAQRFFHFFRRHTVYGEFILAKADLPIQKALQSQRLQGFFFV